ncbi:hypothetical protein EYC58_05185 [Candidatus Saccharibacteria bacterium]|nr:MAG: hypothetical protein EYC58_05185 [Candidatus Saccharibacteria bacterium]
MSLTDKDFQQIRFIVREEATSIMDAKLRERIDPIDEKIDTLSGQSEAIGNDVRAIYFMISDMTKRIDQKSLLDPNFLKLPEKEQLLRLNDVLLATAKRLGVTLPR